MRNENKIWWRKNISKSLIFCMLLTASPVAVLAQEGQAAISSEAQATANVLANQQGPERSVGDWEQFKAAIADPSVTKITLTQNITTEQPKEDVPMVIQHSDKDLVIDGQGKEISTNLAGIVLGRNTTFKNVRINFKNSIRNAIIANGYALELDNVDTSSSTWEVSLFAGAMTNSKQQHLVPQIGREGIIILKNNTTVNHIFAGSLDDVSNDERPVTYIFPGSINIIIDSSFSADKIGTIYGMGAREDRSGQNGNGWFPDDAYGIQDGTYIRLNTSKSVKQIEGGGHTSLIYNDSKNYSTEISLKNLTSLELESGKLTIAPDSNLNKLQVLQLEKNIQLNITKLPNTIKLLDLVGRGGTLVLGEAQHLQIEDIKGTTKIGIKDVFLGKSEGVPKENHIYITAKNSKPDSFELLPFKNGANYKFEYNPQTNAWIVKNDLPSFDNRVILDKVEIIKNKNQVTNTEVLIPLAVSYQKQPNQQDILNVPFNVEVGDKTVAAVKKDDGSYIAQVTFEGISAEIEFGEYEYNNREQHMSIHIGVTPGMHFEKDKTYHFNIIFDKDYVSGSMDKTLPVEFTISDNKPSEQKPMVIFDESEKTVEYDGQAHSLTAKVKMPNGDIQNGNITYKYQKNGTTEQAKDTPPKDAGTYTVTASYQYNNEEITKDATLTIQPKNITVTADAKTKKYGQPDPELTYTVDNKTPLVSGDTLAGKLERQKGENKNTKGYTIQQGTLKNPNYNITFQSNQLKIEPAEIEIDVTPKSLKPGEQAEIIVTAKNKNATNLVTGTRHPLNVTVLADDHQNITLTNQGNGTWKGSYAVPQGANQKNATFKVMVNDVTGNYQRNVEKTIVVPITDQEMSKTQVTLTPNKTENLTYGDSLTYTVSVSEKEKANNAITGTTVVTLMKDGQEVGKQTLQGANGTVTFEPKQLKAGNYTVKATYEGNAQFEPSSTEVQLTVAKKQLNWNPEGLDPVSKTEGVADEVAVTGTLTLTGVISNDQVTIQPATGYKTQGFADKIAVGEYVVDVIADTQWSLAGADAENYTLPAENPKIKARVVKKEEPQPVPPPAPEPEKPEPPMPPAPEPEKPEPPMPPAPEPEKPVPPVKPDPQPPVEPQPVPPTPEPEKPEPPMPPAPEPEKPVPPVKPDPQPPVEPQPVPPTPQPPVPEKPVEPAPPVTPPTPPAKPETPVVPPVQPQVPTPAPQPAVSGYDWYNLLNQLSGMKQGSLQANVGGENVLPAFILQAIYGKPITLTLTRGNENYVFNGEKLKAMKFAVDHNHNFADLTSFIAKKGSTSSSKAPQTGDNTPVGLLASLAAMSAGALGILGIKKRKKK